ncbi:MAG: dephospho-CoA kinase [Aurantimicrobium sp.]|nr:dephospho-CoA kinase [Aurantimicrobium sp.]
MLVALTGGIAAGKSTVSRMLAECGATIVDADVLAREAVAVGSAGLAAVTHAFGSQVLTESGALDRAALGNIVFIDEDARRRLEAIVHPEVARLSAEAFASAERQKPGGIVIYDVPLLVEAGRKNEFDAVIVVEAPDDVRRHRLINERGMTEQEAQSRLAAQATNAERRALADYVISSEFSLEDTRREAETVYAQLVRSSRTDG